MLYYAAYITAEGAYKQGLYTPEEYFTEVFNPGAKIRFLSGLKPRTKDEARELAINVKAADVETADNNGNLLTMGECSILAGVFERSARRFGLVREFRENAII